MTIECHSCHAEFEDYKELALHISSSRKGHRQGKRWASKYLMINGLSAKNRRDIITRVPDTQERTEFGDNNRETAKREISGDNEYINTLCPQCKKPHRQLIPVEHIHNELAWRKDGVLCVICDVCRR